MAEKAHGYTQGFGEFFFDSLSQKEEQATVIASPLQADEAISPETKGLLRRFAPRNDNSPEHGLITMTQADASKTGALLTSSQSVLFQNQAEKLEKTATVTSDEQEIGIWHLAFDETSNPVATLLYRAFLREGIVTAEIAGERKDGTDKVVTASDVLGYLDRNYTSPEVQRALKSQIVRIPRFPWTDRKGKILPKYAGEEFQRLSLTQKISAFCADKAQGKKTGFYLMHAAWWQPTDAARHEAVGKHAMETGNYELAHAAFFNASQLNPESAQIREALKNAVFQETFAQFTQAGDATQKLFYGIRLELLEGNLSAAKLKMVEFKKLAAETQDPALATQREEVRYILRTLTLKEVAKLAEANDALRAQRLQNLEMNYYDEKTAQANAGLLVQLQTYLEQGAVDTLEEGMVLLKADHERLETAFWKNPLVKENWAVHLPYRKPRYGSEAHKAERSAAAELVHAFKKNPEDSRFIEKDAFASVPYLRLEGGMALIPSEAPPAIRVVIGKKGGIIRMGEMTYTFPASDRERAVILTENFLLAPQLQRYRDYREDSHFGAPTPAVPKTTQDYAGGHPEALAGLLAHWGRIDFVDPDFKTLFDLETKSGWEKTATSEARRTHLLASAEELRHRNGSYLVTAEILEGIFAADLEKALKEVSTEQIQSIWKKAENERASVGLRVSKQIYALKEEQPEIYAQRFPQGKPSEEEFKAMVTQAIEAKVAMQVRKLAFARLDAWHQQGKMGDPLAAKAWDIYEDLKDPLDKTWNLADESWDRIVDEVVITAITLPITMGVGTLVRGSLSATTLALRWSAQGGLRAFAARAAIFTAGAVAEGFVQEGLTSTIYGTDFQLKNAGFNVLMSSAFHGGNKLWNRAIANTRFGEEALRAARNRGESILVKSAVNFAGSMTTQTAVATGLTYVEDFAHGESQDKTVWERIGGSGIRMLSYHFATRALGQGFTASEQLGVARLKHAQERFNQLKKSGIRMETALDRSVAEAKALEWNPITQSVYLPQEKRTSDEPVFAAFFKEHAEHLAQTKKSKEKTSQAKPKPTLALVAEKKPFAKVPSGETTPEEKREVTAVERPHRLLVAAPQPGTPEHRARVEALREPVSMLAEAAGLTRLQDRGALMDWALENWSTPEKIKETLRSVDQGKIALEVEGKKVIVLLRTSPESQARERHKVASRMREISNEEIELIDGKTLPVPRETPSSEKTKSDRLPSALATRKAAELKLKSEKSSERSRLDFENVLYPSKQEETDRAVPKLQAQVEILDATDQVVVRSERPSFGALEYPGSEHNPVYSVVENPKQEEVYRQFQAEGSLRTIPLAEYFVELSGMQRYRDTLSRLKALYGERLQVELESEKETHCVLLGADGSALVQVVLRGKPLPTPTEAEVRAALAAVPIFELTKWREERSLRGDYAWRILELMGAKKDSGALRYGTRLSKLQKRIAEAKTPVEKVRAAEELAVALAYVRDIPKRMEEYEAAARAAEEDFLIEEVILEPAADATDPMISLSAWKKTLGLGLGLATFFQAGAARAAEQVGDTAPSTDSPLIFGLGVGTGVLLSIGGWFLYKMTRPAPVPAEKNPPKKEVGAAQPKRDTHAAQPVKKSEETSPLHTRRAPNAKTPLPDLELAVPLTEPFFGLDENRDGKPRRAEYSQKLAGKQYGPHAAQTHEGLGNKATYNEDGFVQGDDWSLVIDEMSTDGSKGPAGAIFGKAFADYMSAPGSDKDLAKALLTGHHAVLASPYAKSGGVAVAKRVVATGNGEYELQVVNVGDAGLEVFAPNARGEFERVNQTEEQSYVAEKRREGKLRNTLEMRIHPRASEIQDGWGATFEPDVQVYRFPLKKNYRVVSFSDGVGDAMSAQERAEILKNSPDAETAAKKFMALALTKQVRLDTARKIIRGQGTGGRLVPTKEFPLTELDRDGNPVPVRVAELDELPGHYITSKGRVFDARTRKEVDFYKTDNLTVHVYDHQPAEIPSRRNVQFFPKVETDPAAEKPGEKTLILPKFDIHDEKTTLFAQEKTQVLPHDATQRLTFLQFPEGSREIQVEGVRIWKRRDGKIFLQNTQEGLEVYVGKSKIPYDTKNSFPLKSGEEVRIGGKTYLFRGDI